MFDKPQSTHVLGLDMDGFSLKGAALNVVRGKLNIEEFFDFFIEITRDEKGNVKPLYTPEKKAIIEDFSDHNLVVSAAKTQEILVRPLDLKLTKEKDIDAALPFQVEPLLPYPVENAIMDRILLSKDKEGSKLTVFCIRKDHLTQHLDLWNTLEINPEIVSAAPQALVLFTNHFFQNNAQYLNVYIGIENSFAILVDQGKLLAAQAIPAGIASLIDLYAQEKSISKPQALEAFSDKSHSLNFSASQPLKEAVDEIRMAVTRTTFSLAKQLKGKDVGGLIITGPGSTVDAISEIIYAQLSKTKLQLNEDACLGKTPKELLNYALPIGAALSAIPGSKEQINFRQNEFSYPEPWKRIKQPVLQYLVLCLGIAAALFFFGKTYISYKEGALKQQYLDLLAGMNKPYTPFEEEFSEKTFGKKDQGIANAANLTLEDIQTRLSYIRKDIQSTPQTFPLLPSVPRVSDVLAWIGSHPNFINKQSDQKKEEKGSMHIQHFSYNMVKRPEPTKKQDKYQVKVEMEFSSPTPKMAREFHDALIAPNDMVDPKGEIKWNANRDLYRTSFYLKDKTVYPAF